MTVKSPIGWDSDEERDAYRKALADLREANDAMTLRMAMAAEDDSHSLAKAIIGQVKQATDTLQAFPVDSKVKTLSGLIGTLAEFISSLL